MDWINGAKSTQLNHSINISYSHKKKFVNHIHKQSFIQLHVKLYLICYLFFCSSVLCHLQPFYKIRNFTQVPSIDMRCIFLKRVEFNIRWNCNFNKGTCRNKITANHQIQLKTTNSNRTRVKIYTYTKMAYLCQVKTILGHTSDWETYSMLWIKFNEVICLHLTIYNTYKQINHWYRPTVCKLFAKKLT